jgi:anti-sigma-K factor RskA/putative zinc finger protein
MNAEDVHALTAAYALDALDHLERQRYERHLTGCGACRTELRGFREVSGRLATVAATETSPALRGRVLTAVADAQPSSATAAATHVRRLRVAVAGAVAAAAVVAASVFGILLANSHDRLTASERKQQEIAAVLSAPDCKILHAPLRTGGTATVVMSPHMRSLVVTASDVRPAPSGKRYQLWLMRATGDVRAGTLPASGKGPVMVFADRSPGGQRLGISLESDPHPSQPSVPMLAVIQL